MARFSMAPSLSKPSDGMFPMIPADPAELIQNLALLLSRCVMISLHDRLDILSSRYWAHHPLLCFGNRDFESTNQFWVSFGNI